MNEMNMMHACFVRSHKLRNKINSNDIYGGIQHSLIYMELIVLNDSLVSVPIENPFQPNHSMKHALYKI